MVGYGQNNKSLQPGIPSEKPWQTDGEIRFINACPLLNQSKNTYITENSRYISICLWVIPFLIIIPNSPPKNWHHYLRIKSSHTRYQCYIATQRPPLIFQLPYHIVEFPPNKPPMNVYKTKFPPVLCFWGLCWWVQRASNNVFCWVLLRRLVLQWMECHVIWGYFFFQSSQWLNWGECKHSVHPPFLDIFPACISGLHFFSNCRIFKSMPVRRLLEIRVPTWAMKKKSPPLVVGGVFLWGVIHAYTSLCYGGLLYPIVEIWVPTLAAAVRSWTR